MSVYAAAIFGKPGSGKSTCARSMIGRESRVVVLDPTAEWKTLRGYKAVATLQELSNAMASNYKSFRLVYKPPKGTAQKALDHVAALLWRYQVERGCKGRFGGVMLVVEEMAESYKNAHQDSMASANFSDLILQRRHAGVSIIGISQRPQDVAAKFRDNTDQVCVFRLKSKRAQDHVADELATYGSQWVAKLQTLPLYTYVNVQNDKVTLRKTRRI